jgi:GT2 family glycosyltransferase
MSSPRVVAIVVSWNTAAATRRCVEALARCAPAPARVVVVDNASADDSIERLRTLAAPPAVLRLDRNDGFAVAFAAGVAQAPDADALWLLNSDALPEPDALAALLAAWRTHGDDALYGAAPLRRDTDGATWLDFPTKFLDPELRWPLWRRDAAIRYDAAWRAAPPRRVAALAGSALLVPALLRRHGGMDPRWFLYCEETDWCLRLRAVGVASWLVPQARVAHAGGASHAGRRGVADVVAYYRARNEVRLLRRHRGIGAAGAAWVRKAARAVALLAWDPVRAGHLARALADVLLGRDGKVLAPEAALEDPLRPQQARLGVRLRARAARALRREAAPVLACEWVGPSRIRHAATPAPFLRAWQQHLVDALARALARQTAAHDLWLDGLDRPDVPPPGPVVAPLRRIGLQWEHTLVRPGGRDAADAVAGGTPLADGSGRYLLRVAQEARLRACDLVVDYAEPNLAHLRAGGRHDALLAKARVLAPRLYAPQLEPQGRDLPLLSLMHDLRQPRRARFVAAARSAGLPLRNVRGVWAADTLQRLHRRTRILVNLRQTDDHHSFEALRVLPALLCGVVVVSEDVPLRHTLPYADHVVWCGYDSLLPMLQAVHADWDAWHARLFGDGRFAALCAQLQRDDDAALDAQLARWAAEST